MDKTERKEIIQAAAMLASVALLSAGVGAVVAWRYAPQIKDHIHIEDHYTVTDHKEVEISVLKERDACKKIGGEFSFTVQKQIQSMVFYTPPYYPLETVDEITCQTSPKVLFNYSITE